MVLFVSFLQSDVLIWEESGQRVPDGGATMLRGRCPLGTAPQTPCTRVGHCTSLKGSTLLTILIALLSGISNTSEERDFEWGRVFSPPTFLLPSSLVKSQGHFHSEPAIILP